MSGNTTDPTTRLIVGSVATIVFELCIGHILECFKIKQQTTDLSITEIYGKLTATKGVIGMWDGFLPWGLLMAASKGASFAFGQSLAQNILNDHLSAVITSDKVILILSSAIGGLVQGVIMSPLLLLKTRVLTHPRFRSIKGGVLETVKESAKIGSEIVMNEGLFGLCKGMEVFAFKRLCDWLTRFLFVELIQQYLMDDQMRQQISMRITAGLVGGVLSCMSTMSIDVLVARTQDSAAKTKSSMDLLKEQRKSQWQRGLYMRILHVALTTLLMKNAVPFLTQLWLAYSEDHASKPEL